MTIKMKESYLLEKTFQKETDEVGVCILAAGLAKRLEPISAIIAKPAFPLGGRVPIVELWVRKFVSAGLNKIVMNLHRVPESISEYFKNGSKFLSEIYYANESKPSGTLGGVLKMLKEFHKNGFYPKRIFIPSGDIVSGVSNEQLKIMYDQHVKKEAIFTMMLAPIPLERRGDFGTTILEGIESSQNVKSGTYARIQDFIEKDPNSPSNENNASLYLVETEFLLSLEEYITDAKVEVEDPCYDFGKHILMGIVGRVPHLKWLEKYKEKLYGYEPGTFWFDIGNKRDYLAVNKAILQNEIQIDLPYERYPWGWIGDNVEVNFDEVTIKAPIVIGSNCHIFPGAEIGPNVVIGDGWTIHRGAKIRDSVLWPAYNNSSSNCNNSTGAREVGENITIENSVIVGGSITSDIISQTADALPNGKLDIRSIDWIPKGPRA